MSELNIVVVLGTHNTTRFCWQGHDCAAGQASPQLVEADHKYKVYSWVSFKNLWLAYTGCQMIYMRLASEIKELHWNCHNECTMWILNQVELLRC